MPRLSNRGFALQTLVWVGSAGVVVSGLIFAPMMLTTAPVPTTLDDFFVPGTQPGALNVEILSASDCDSCHGGYDPSAAPYDHWVTSMMGQAARDPIFQACLSIANQDAAFSGDLCLRCHTPGGWLAGRSVPTDGSSLLGVDKEGVSCNFCHRMVDHQYDAANPPEDLDILAAVSPFPENPHTGSYVIDPDDNRRGPFDLGNFNSHEWRLSPYHRESLMCATCHDVSNPVFELQPDGAYVAGTLGAPSASSDKYTLFPVERTYSEWLASEFARGPVEMGGRFGGNLTAVSSCQDCHMPDTTGRGCNRNSRPVRDDMPTHFFLGGSTWALDAIRGLYPDSETGLNDSNVALAHQRTLAFMGAAADLDANQHGSTLSVRVTNHTGHKLPTGYPEGRRMWVRVEFRNDAGETLAEHGRYDPVSATLFGDDTTVYEAKLGVDDAVSTLTGIPAGVSFHFAVNSVWVKDNRIPPRGFTNAAFEAVQASPVGHTYADGQHWDDADFTVPPGAAMAEVELLYQSASREYVEFLRDANTTDSRGQELYDQWLLNGKGAPLTMALLTVPLSPVNDCAADVNGDGLASPADFTAWLGCFGDPGSAPYCARADVNRSGTVDPADFTAWLGAFQAGCP